MNNDYKDNHFKLNIEWPPIAIVREVIEVQFRRGEGTNENDPVRFVTAYYAFDGTLLAEYDPSRGTIR